MKNLIEKNKIIIVILLILSILQNCSLSNKIRNINKKFNNIEETLFILSTNKIDKNYLEKIIELNILIHNKNILYDWNSIVRTNVRPDDKMNEYDKMIKKLRDEIDNNNK